MVGIYCRIWDLWFVCGYLSQVVRSLICLWVFITVCEFLISLCGFIQGVRSVQFAAVCGFMSKSVFLSAICVCMSQMVSLIPSDWGLWAFWGMCSKMCVSLFFLEEYDRVGGVSSIWKCMTQNVRSVSCMCMYVFGVWITAPHQEVHFLIPGNYDYVNLHGKGDFAGMIKLSILRWGGYPRLPG